MKNKLTVLVLLFFAFASINFAQVPTITTTTAISSITAISAASGGSGLDDQGSAITAKGVCWNTTGTPLVTESNTNDGSGTADFTSSITGLTAGTTYYVRAYATNGNGTGYGPELSFTTLATVTTTAISSITATTVSSGGTVTDAGGGGGVTTRGVCWNTGGSPTTADPKTTDGSGAGVFVSSITPLLPGTTYYVRSYATNGTGTAYGNEISFTTLATVTTTAISAIGTTVATSGGNVTSGGASVTARGVVWATTPSPTINPTSNGSGAGVFTSNITGLTASTTYYVRAYATNAGGTAYGSDVSFSTIALSAPTLTAPTLYQVGVSVLPTLSWTGVVDATAYQLEISTSNSPFSSITISPSYATPATSHTFTYETTSSTILTNGTTYYWRVQQTTPAGTSAWANGEFKTVTEAKPKLNPITPGATSAYISWYPQPYSSGLTYDLLWSTSSNMSGYNTEACGTDTYFTLPLAQGSTYYVQVVAKNSTGSVIISFSAVSAPINPAALPKPTLSWPINGATTYSNPPTLSWYTSTYDASYTYIVKYWRDGEAVPTLPTGQTAASGYFDTGSDATFTTLTADLTAGATYNWKVATTNDGGTHLSTFSDTKTFVVYNSTPTTPPVPTPSWPTGNATVYFNPPMLSWYISSYATGLKFKVEWSINSDMSSPLGNSGWIDDLYYTLPSTLTPGVQHYWHVKSKVVSSGSESAYSSPVSFTIAASAAGGAPQPIPTNPVGGITVDSPLSGVTLNWYANSTSDLDYDVKISPYNDVTSGVLSHPTVVTKNDIVGSTSIAVSDIPITLVAGAPYYWQVRSKLRSTPTTVSSWSYVVSFVTAAGASAAIVPLAIVPNNNQPINNTTAVLTWSLPTKSSSYLTYDVQYSKDKAFQNPTVITNVNEKVTQISGLESKSTYYWRVLSKNSFGTVSSYSQPASFSTSAVTAVEESENIPTQFELSQNYPNPFNPTTKISYALPQNAFVNIKVYDMLGREVKSLVNNEMLAGNHSIEWNGLDNSGNKVASGAYIYRIAAGNPSSGSGQGFISTKKMVLLK